MREKIHQLVEKAERALKASERLLDDGHWDFSVSRAYYAMFYVTEALLLTKGLAASKHSGLLALLYEHFIKPGLMDKRLHRTLVLFFGLGVGPLLLIAITFGLPTHWKIPQYQTFIGLLLIISTISTLCLVGLITRLLKRPINRLLSAQKELQKGNLTIRLPVEGSFETQSLFSGFNNMATEIGLSFQREKQLAEERSFSQLASRIIHDLRSPIATLEVAARALESPEDETAAPAEAAHLLRLSCQRLKGLVEELLSRGKQEAASAQCSLQEAIEELMLEYRHKFPETLRFEVALPSAAIFTRGSKKDLQRMMGNIVNNAIEAMHGEGRISIAVTLEGETSSIRITDSGPGMSEDILKKVLNGGFTYGKEDGHGIGMTIVQEIVAKCGGSLEARSKVGKGTTFTIQMPIQKSSSISKQPLR